MQFSYLLLTECPMLNLRTDDIYLTRFLSCCDWNVTDAFIRMTKLFKLKVNVIGKQPHSFIVIDFKYVSSLFIAVREPQMVFQQKARRLRRHSEAQRKDDVEWSR